MVQNGKIFINYFILYELGVKIKIQPVIILSQFNLDLIINKPHDTENLLATAVYKRLFIKLYTHAHKITYKKGYRKSMAPV